MHPRRFLGFGVRHTRVPDGFGIAGIERICSVADCIATRPEGWVARWDFNRACCYATAEMALHTAAGGTEFELMAYSLVGVRSSRDGRIFTVDADSVFLRELPALPEGLAPEGWATLGYDALSQPPGLMDFSCSPLSCNGLANVTKVNRFCLLDDVDAALRLAARWDVEEPEPGPFYVVEVLAPPGTETA